MNYRDNEPAANADTCGAAFGDIRALVNNAGILETQMRLESMTAERMRRGGTPDEVALAILWLLSDEASCTTGSFIDVAGGR